MNKLEDLIITLNHNLVLTRDYLLMYLLDENNDDGFLIDVPVRHIDIKHVVSGFHTSYTLDKDHYFRYNASEDDIHLEYITIKRGTINIRISSDLSSVNIYHEAWKKRHSKNMVFSECIRLIASSKFYIYYNSNSYTSTLVFINDKKRFEMYKCDCHDIHPRSNYSNIISFIDDIKSGKNNKNSNKSVFDRVIDHKKHKISNAPHKQICTHVIHKLDEYSLADYNTINHIIDFLYPYRY